MTNQNKEEPLKRHAIQLESLKVLELSIKANPSMEDSLKQQIGEADFSLVTGYTEYKKEEHKIGVKISAEIVEEQEKLPFSLRVELVGIFDVDENRFPIMHIEHWARTNAPLVLYPYLREQVFGLTTRAGFEGILLPLFEIPTFKVSLPTT